MRLAHHLHQHSLGIFYFRLIVPADLQTAVGRKVISERSSWKWLGRFRAHGDAGLHDASSRPRQIVRRLSTAKSLNNVVRINS